MERQQSWGWKVIADVFAGGVGAGLFLVSFLLEQFYEPTTLTRVGSIVAPILVIISILFLLAEVGKPVNSIRAFLNLGTSWMSRGVILILLVVIFQLLYALLPLGFPGIKTAVPGIVIGSLAALLAVVAGIYYGLLLSQAKGIALWNSPLFPILYFFSGLAGGAGILLLLSPFVRASPGQLNLVMVMALVLVCLVLISLWLMTAIRPSHAYRQSLSKLLSPSFIGISLVLGYIVPLVLLVISLFMSEMGTYGMRAVSGALVLIGAYHLRYATIKAGHYYSLQV